MPRTLTRPLPRAAFVAALLTAVVGSGCTASLSTIRLVAADKAVRAADEAGAEVHAPFELEMARRHLDKAVEESSQSAYRDAIDLAREAEAFAAEAERIAKGGDRNVSENVGEDLTDDGSLTPPPAEESEELEDRDPAEPDDGDIRRDDDRRTTRDDFEDFEDEGSGEDDEFILGDPDGDDE